LQFTSAIFLVYLLPTFLGLYFLAAPKYKNALLLVFSLFFYSWGEPLFVFALLGSTILDYFVVKAMHKRPTKKQRLPLLILSLGLNLGLLFFFKYGNFIQENLLWFTGNETTFWYKFILPLGISFYTFQTLTYAIDVYRNDTLPLPRLSHYLLYIFSFPQLIAGPIVRFGTIRDQIIDRKNTLEDKLIGFYRFCIGLGKKVLIADVLEQQVDLVFELSSGELSTGMAWVGAIAFTFQIYFDFSAYSDMAIGLGRMMGFRFPENFNAPFIARNLTEFWRRWHITLTDFMRDYLYIPLGGNRTISKWRNYRNLWIVFLLTGFWHGASWNFILWGAFHGAFLMLDKLFLKRILSSIGQLSVLFTFIVVAVGCVIFKIESMEDLFVYLDVLFTGGSDGYLRLVPSFIAIASIAAFFSFLPSIQFGKKMMHFFFFRDTYNVRQHMGLTLISIMLFLLSLSMIVAADPPPFIYSKF